MWITTNCEKFLKRWEYQTTWFGAHQKKDVPCLKTKNKPQWDGRTWTIMIKSNSIPARWVFHKLENNNTKEVFPLLWRFWAPRQVSQPGDLTGTGKSQGIWPWRPVGFDYRTSTRLGEIETSVLQCTKKSYTHQHQRKGAVTPRETEPKLPASVGGSPAEVWVGSGSTQDRGTGSSSPRRSPLA